VYTNIQPVIKSVDNRFDKQPVGCLFARYSRLSIWLYNRFDNRLRRVNGVLHFGGQETEQQHTVNIIG